MISTSDLQKLATEDLRSVRLDVVAFHSCIGDMDTFTFMYSVPALADLRGHHENSVAIRKDFDLDDEDPGNRPLDEKWSNRIAEGLYDRPDTPIQMITLAVPPKEDGQPTFVTEEVAVVDGATRLVKFRLYAGAPAYIENGQHTLEGIVKTWDRVKAATTGKDAEVRAMLTKATAMVQIVVQGDRNEINRMFVIAAQTKPISAALTTALDQSSYANRLGTQVGRKARLLADEPDRLVYLRSAAREESLYSTAHVRGFATASLIGFKDRTPVQREENIRRLLEKRAGNQGNLTKALTVTVDEIVSVLDDLYKKLPGWKDLRRSSEGTGLSPKQFRNKYLHGSPAGLYVIGGVMGAVRHSGASLVRTTEELAKLPWDRDKTEEREDRELGVIRSHPLFEGMLVRNEKVIDADGQVRWIATTAGGARTNYEAATIRVLQLLAKRHPELAQLEAAETLEYLGLRSSRRRGRPRKIA